VAAAGPERDAALVEIIEACDETLRRLAGEDDELVQELMRRVQVRRATAERRLHALAEAARLRPPSRD
jgi:hypothetical protein